MRAILALAGWVILNQASTAQKLPLEVHLGPEIKHKANFPEPEKAFSLEQHGIFIQRESDDPVIHLERYDHAMNLLSDNKFTPKRAGSTLEPWFLFKHDGDMMILARSLQKGSDSAWFHLSRIDPGTLEPAREWHDMGAVDTKGKKLTVHQGLHRQRDALIFSTRERGIEFQYSTVASENGEYRMFYTDYAMDKNEDDVYGFVVVDKDLTVLWKKNVSIGHLEKEFDHWSARMGDNGTVYLHGRKVKGGGDASMKGGVPNYAHHIIAIDEDGILFDKEVTLGSKGIKSARVDLRDGEMIMLGLYHEHESWEARGFFVHVFDPITGDRKQGTEHPFTASLFEQLFGSKTGTSEFNKYVKDKKNGIEQLKIDGIYRRGDGGYRLTCERRWKRNYQQTRNTPGGGGRITYQKTTYIPIFHGEEIISFDLDRDGQLARTTVIHKKQEVMNGQNFYSFTQRTGPDGDGTFYLFNDHPNNQTLDANDPGKVANWKGGKGCVSVVHVDDRGEQRRHALFNVREEETLLYPSMSIKISPTEQVILCRHKANERWLRLSWSHAD
jgi:hypothetical protein